MDDAAGARRQRLERVFLGAPFGFAPASSNAFTMGAWFSEAAIISAVWPRHASEAFTAAPLSSSAVDGRQAAAARGQHQRRLALRRIRARSASRRPSAAR